jgi:CheY-like chemotaxis protein
MPGGMDGASLAVQVRAARPRLAVLLMTGYTEQLEAIAARGFEVLPKPFSPRALTEAIERVFAAQDPGAGGRPVAPQSA